jgi:hypothetical protein
MYPESVKGDPMKDLTTTKATYRDIAITVSFDRFGGNRVFSCASSLVGQRKEDKWFPTQGEAIANERRDIDTKLGIVPSTEVRRYSRWK